MLPGTDRNFLSGMKEEYLPGFTEAELPGFARDRAGVAGHRALEKHPDPFNVQQVSQRLSSQAARRAALVDCCDSKQPTLSV